MEKFQNLTEQQKLVRKRWLRCFKFQSWILGPYVAILIALAIFSLDFATVAAALFLAFVIVGSLVLSYRCAYKSPGVIMLVLNMIGCGIEIIKQLFYLFTRQELNLITPCILIPLLIWIFKTSWHLRKLNSSLANPESSKA